MSQALSGHINQVLTRCGEASPEIQIARPMAS